MNIPSFKDILSQLFGVKPAQKLEQKAPLVFSMLNQLEAAAVSHEVNSLLSHNISWAAQNISKGLDAVGEKGLTRPVVDSLISQGLSQIHINIGSTPVGDSSVLNFGAPTQDPTQGTRV